MRIGVLALQGDFHMHALRLMALGAEPAEIRKPEHLKSCHGLIIPGGESTTLIKLLRQIGLYSAIPEFCEHRPIFGTCAGAILLASSVSDERIRPLGLIDITVDRNAYGRQIDSFIDRIELDIDDETVVSEGVFIRAPKITAAGPSTRVLGRLRDAIICVENDRVLAATFHPELSDDTLIHRYFLDKIRKTA